MMVLEAFELLGIEKTNDRRRIKLAYKRLLPSYNPEDDEAAFLKLRQAYEIADKYAVNAVDDELFDDSTEIPIVAQNEAFIHTSIFEEKKEENRLGVIVESIDKIYRSPEKRNDITEWEKIFNHDVFLSLEYNYVVKMQIIELLTDKYMLKSSTIRYISEQMEQTNPGSDIWNLFPSHYVSFWMNKRRDMAGYTDILFEDIKSTEETILLQELSDIFGISDAHSVLEYMDELLSRYEESLSIKIWAIGMYQQSDEQVSLKDEKIKELEIQVLKGFLKYYIYDDVFMYWQHGYINSTKWTEEGNQLLRYSKLGEYKLTLDYIRENLSKLALLENETERMLIEAHLDISKAWNIERQSRADAVKLWKQAKEKLRVILEIEPDNSSALFMNMIVGTELYDFDMVIAGYEKVKKQMQKNPAIYVLIVKAYLAIGRDKEAKAVFDLAEQNKISDYELGIMHLHFRKHYDFIDGYDLEEALVEGHMLIEEMLQNGVCGELLAEMYYALGCLVYCDGRYTNAGEYADWALEICEKPKYYFLKGVDNTSNRKYYYKDALTSLMKVINLKDKWDDGESENPRFAGEVEYDVDLYLNNCYTTDLYTLYVQLGHCCENTNMLFEAMDYYKKALLIKWDKIKVVAGFERTATALIRKRLIQVDKVEAFVSELSEDVRESYPIKFLQAILAYEKGDEELVITLLTQITKMKTTKSGEQAFLDDYKKFACYFKAKIYIKREKYAIAKMSLRIFENAGGSIVPENHRKIIKITKDALKLIKHE